MSDYHLLGLVLVPVIGVVAAIVIIFLCKDLDLCLPAGPGPYAHLANDGQERIRSSQRRRQKESEMERGMVACTAASGAGPSAPIEVMAARAPLPPGGPVKEATPAALMRLLGRDCS